MVPNPADIAAVAAQYSIPPAVLMAVGQHESGYSDAVISGQRRGAAGEVGAFQFMPATAQSYGVQPQDLAGNFVLQLSLAARMLHDLYAKNGSWQAALSAYNSGNPNAYKQGGQVAGYVNSVLGIAGTQPTYGMAPRPQDATTGMGGGLATPSPSPFTPSDLDFWRGTSQDFATNLAQMAQSGGAVNSQGVTSFTQAAGLGSSSGSGSTAGALGSNIAPGGASVPFQFDQSPFDPKYMGAETEAQGDRSGPGGYAEVGNDYGLPHGTPLTAPVSGTVHVVDMGHAGTGLTAYIKMDNGWTVGLGHLAAVQAQEGARVTAGQVVAASGGDPNLDTSPGNTTGAHIEFQLINPSNQFVDPHPLLQAASGKPPTQPPASATQGAGGTSPDVEAITAFAQQAMANGVDPAHLTDNISQAVSMMRMLTGNDTMSLHQYGQISGMDGSAMLDYFRQQPHGTYQGLTAGQFHDTSLSASIYSLQHQKRQPENAEVARFATIGATPQMMKDYYQQTAQGSGSPASIPTAETFSTTHGAAGGIRSQ